MDGKSLTSLTTRSPTVIKISIQAVPELDPGLALAGWDCVDHWEAEVVTSHT